MLKKMETSEKFSKTLMSSKKKQKKYLKYSMKNKPQKEPYNTSCKKFQQQNIQHDSWNKLTSLSGITNHS